MSDDLSTELSAELSTALRELAAQAETPPVLSGAEVRARAVRRARRRLAGTLGATATALALVAFALTANFTAHEDGKGAATGAGAGRQSQTPSATPADPSPSPPSLSSPPSSSSPSVSVPVPVVGTLDLVRRTLTVKDQVLRMSSEYFDSAGLTSPLTVYRTYDAKPLVVTDLTDGTRHVLEMMYAVELRDARDERVYIGFDNAYDVQKPEGDESGSSWIGLAQADAKWFHGLATVGTSFALTTLPTAATPPTATTTTDEP
ncbi:hypothetical protein [Streptomyces sp. NPDC000618]|uniref:hypothetical protein n=1 Tax=Streptomyces sp. NPDC000618 TaxID=3154265 RepID=UPI00331B9EA4